jgi:cyclopropane fatty-acyl-phospholipid synthase-like methyltransferase
MSLNSSNFYKREFELYGKDARSLGWSKNSQELRFETLKQMVEIRGKSLLDIGCGFADLFVYLKNANLLPSKYVGIEPFEPFYKISEQNLKDDLTASVFSCDFQNFSSEEKFDFVVAIGICNLKIQDNYQYLFELIDRMLLFSIDLVFISVLSNSAPKELQILNQDLSFYFDENQVSSHLEKLGYAFTIHKNYLPHDMFIEIKRGGTF